MSCPDVRGIVTSVSASTEGMFLEEHNEFNQVCERFLYDVHGSVNITVQVGKSFDAPSIGDEITVGGVKYQVSRSEFIEGNTQFRKFALTVDRYAHVKVKEPHNKLGMSKEDMKNMAGLGSIGSMAGLGDVGSMQ